MRPTLAALTVPLLCLAAPPSPVSAEVTRTLRVQLTGDPAAAFAVENLAGAMRVTAGSGEAVIAVATVHAETNELADSVRFEQVVGDKGAPTLRVRYPLDRHTRYRYPGQGHDEGWLAALFGGSRSQTKYDGRRVTVSVRHGVLLYADVEVQVPRRAITGTFRQAVGPLEGRGLEGAIRFDTGSGQVTLHGLKGDVVADTGSGDVKAADLTGSFRCDTGSGDCDLSGFEGERLSCDTGSGDIKARSVKARRVAMDTGSGDIQVTDADIEEFEADTGSGDVELDSRGSRLTRVNADTGSGDVTLRLGPNATFEARAQMGSGDIVNRYPDGEPILSRREIVGYRRGDGRIRIAVDTGSGDVILDPGRPPR